MSKLINNVPDFMTSVASFYDIICNPCSQARIDYYDEGIRKYTSNSFKHILDLGCCTGETAIRLSDKDYQIDGIDISTGMIDISNKKSVENNLLNFYVADMRIVHCSKRYDVIYCNCLEWLESYEDLENMLRSATNMLNSDGIIILDFPNSINFLKNYSKFTASNAKDKDHIYYKLTRFNDVNENIINSSQTYIHVDKESEIINTYSCDLLWRIHHLKEVETILKDLQFDIVETTGSYNEKTIENSMFIQIIGKKVTKVKNEKIVVKELKPELTQCRIIQMEKEKKEQELKDTEESKKDEKSKI